MVLALFLGGMVLALFLGGMVLATFLGGMVFRPVFRWDGFSPVFRWDGGWLHDVSSFCFGLHTLANKGARCSPKQYSCICPN